MRGDSATRQSSNLDSFGSGSRDDPRSSVRRKVGSLWWELPHDSLSPNRSELCTSGKLDVVQLCIRTTPVERDMKKVSADDLLEEIRALLEERIEKQLSGMRGLVVRPIYNSMMPLHLEMSLAPNVFEFAFLKDGIVQLRRGPASNVDVRIESDAETLRSIFINPSAELFEELEGRRRIRITSLTKKGHDAEGYIRKNLAG